MKNQEGNGQKIGTLLVDRGALREKQIEKLLELQQRDAQAGILSKFGELCVRTGWTGAGDVTSALRAQSQKVLDQAGLGDILVQLGYLSPEKLKEALESQLDVLETVEELVLDRELCTPEQVKLASQLLALQRSGALRRQVNSSFVPFNIMELLISERLDDALAEDNACQCSLCWSNAFSIALNELPPRYVSEQSRILDCFHRFRQEYDVLLRTKLSDAVKKVRINPKAACRSRYSDDVLAKRGFQGTTAEVTVRISNRHAHVDRSTLEALFGKGYELQKLKDLVQPGQYAARETVTIVGPKGQLENVRILGPVRPESQVEISGTDQFILGVRVPVRESGKLDGTPGIRVTGPKGEVDLEKGTIRAMRHVHMLPDDAERMGLKNGDLVTVRLVGDRNTIVESVLVRAKENSALEMHIDTDEANAAGLPAESMGQILISNINA